MARLAAELLDELTPLQAVEVAQQFAKSHPSFEHMVHLTRCQRTALKLLLETNPLPVLRDFFSVQIKRTVSTRTVVNGKWIFNSKEVL